MISLFEITYLRNIKQQDLLANTIEQWRYLGFSEANYQRYLVLLERIWPDVSQGDRLQILVSENGSEFFFNDVFIGAINQAGFGDMFLAIWLSPQTSQPQLRRALIGEQS